MWYEPIVEYCYPLYQWVASTLTWRDAVEIFMLWYIADRCLRWILRDMALPLIGPVCLYGACWIGAQHFNLTTIADLFAWASPWALCIAILIHQERLQKMVLAVRTIPTRTDTTMGESTWIDTLIRLCMHAQSRGYTVRCYIERAHPLGSYLTHRIPCTLPITDDISTLLSSLADNGVLSFTVQSSGVICGLTSQFDEQWERPLRMLGDDAHDAWYADALYVSKYTDGLFICTPAYGATYDICMDGHLVQGIAAYRLRSVVAAALDYPSAQQGTHETQHTHSSRTDSSTHPTI